MARAVVDLPRPDSPTNRYACARRSVLICERSWSSAWPWPTTAPNGSRVRGSFEITAQPQISRGCSRRLVGSRPACLGLGFALALTLEPLRASLQPDLADALQGGDVSHDRKQEDDSVQPPAAKKQSDHRGHDPLGALEQAGLAGKAEALRASPHVAH